jgi:hypothetical protein
MRTSTLYRSVAALLVIVTLCGWAFRAGHGWWMHAAAAGGACDPAEDGSSAHFHAGEEREDACPVCAFCFSVPEILSVGPLPELFPARPYAEAMLLYAPSHVRTLVDPTFRRGPPRR